MGGKRKSENCIPDYFHLWAKINKSDDTDGFHPLIYHMIDVAECTLAIWNYSLCEQTKISFAEGLNLELDDTGHQLAFWAGLHDLGKASPAFQVKSSYRTPILKKQGFMFPAQSTNPAPHGVISTWALIDLLPKETKLNSESARQIAFALGGHHGAWPETSMIQSPALSKSDTGDGAWNVARTNLFRVVKEIYIPPVNVSLQKADDHQVALNTFITLFSGLVSVADWIGSMVEYFPPNEIYQPFEEYSEITRSRANSALENLGWINWQPDGKFLSFASMFPDITSLRPIQTQIISLASDLALPTLTILEAPTGIGKTEVALFLADTWLQRVKGKGVYFAMPTQATSNQMFGRVKKFLSNRYPNRPLNTHLVHGMAIFEGLDNSPEFSSISETDSSNEVINTEGTIKAESWFLPRKRTLLAPFGVGTVDQALMAVLQTRHFFVRLFGLAHKVVVFDEIHAYDTYMSTLFQRLLIWLRSIGTSVILLSATLPIKTRQELIGAWLGKELTDFPFSVYPRLTIAEGSEVKFFPLKQTESHSLTLTWLEPEPERIAAYLKEKLAGGGCAVVICNRVQRAQDVFMAIKQAGFVDGSDLQLFHARFPFQWRKEIEDSVLGRFGKNPTDGNQPNPDRPHKAIVVATQVIEQSLDLDFDFMISDLAPIDLIIQRVGRIHRHAQNQTKRPKRLISPEIAICKPPVSDGLPNFGLDEKVYDLSILLRTWWLLRGQTSLNLPEETPSLIESVYAQTLDLNNWSTDFLNAVKKAEKLDQNKKSKEILEAKKRLVRPPDDEYLITDSNKKLEEDDEGVSAAFKALTRLSEPGLSFICLLLTEDGFVRNLNDPHEQIMIDKLPDLPTIKKFLSMSISLQRRDVVNYFTGFGKTPAAWKKIAPLRNRIPLFFDSQGKCDLESANFTLHLSRDLGLIIEKKENL